MELYSPFFGSTVEIIKKWVNEEKYGKERKKKILMSKGEIPKKDLVYIIFKRKRSGGG